MTAIDNPVTSTRNKVRPSKMSAGDVLTQAVPVNHLADHVGAYPQSNSGNSNFATSIRGISCPDAIAASA
jgi:hypothetical protein